MGKTINIEKCLHFSYDKEVLDALTSGDINIYDIIELLIRSKCSCQTSLFLSMLSSQKPLYHMPESFHKIPERLKFIEVCPSEDISNEQIYTDTEELIEANDLENVDWSKCYIAGGALLSLMRNKQINDIDIFFYDKRDIRHVVGTLVMNNFSITSNTGNAITLYPSKNKRKPIPIQLIKLRHGPPEEVIKSFDMDCCKLTYINGEIKYYDQAKEDIRKNYININFNTVGLPAMNRVIKYSAKYGMSFDKNIFALWPIILTKTKKVKEGAANEYVHANYFDHSESGISTFKLEGV